jgi:hypothetical protein
LGWSYARLSWFPNGVVRHVGTTGFVDSGVAIRAILVRRETWHRVNIVVPSLKVKLCTGARYRVNPEPPLPASPGLVFPPSTPRPNNSTSRPTWTFLHPPDSSNPSLRPVRDSSRPALQLRRQPAGDSRRAGHLSGRASTRPTDGPEFSSVLLLDFARPSTDSFPIQGQFVPDKPIHTLFSSSNPVFGYSGPAKPTPAQAQQISDGRKQGRNTRCRAPGAIPTPQGWRAQSALVIRTPRLSRMWALHNWIDSAIDHYRKHFRV